MSNNTEILAVADFFIEKQLITCYFTRAYILDRDLYKKGLLSLLECEEIQNIFISDEKGNDNYENCVELDSEYAALTEEIKGLHFIDLSDGSSEDYFSCEESETADIPAKQLTEEEEMLQLGLPIQFGNSKEKYKKHKQKQSKKEKYTSEQLLYTSTDENTGFDEYNWLSYWENYGESLIWQSWIEKYKDYIDPSYLNSVEATDKNLSTELKLNSFEEDYAVYSHVAISIEKGRLESDEWLPAEHDDVSLQAEHDDVSLQAEHDDVSLQAEHDGVSLQAEHDGMSLQAEHDGVSLQAEHDGVSLQAEHEECLQTRYEKQLQANNEEECFQTESEEVCLGEDDSYNNNDSWEKLWDEHCKEIYQYHYNQFKALGNNRIVPVIEDVGKTSNLEELQLISDTCTELQSDRETSDEEIKQSEESCPNGNLQLKLGNISQQSSFLNSDDDDDNEPPDEIPIRKKRSHEMEASKENSEKKLKRMGYTMQNCPFTKVDMKYISREEHFSRYDNIDAKLFEMKADDKESATSKSDCVQKQMGESSHFLQKGNASNNRLTKSNGFIQECSLTPYASNTNKNSFNGKMKKYSSRSDDAIPEEVLCSKELLKYWLQRYTLFSKFDKGVKLDYESWFSVTPERIAEHQAERCSCNVIIDAFCGAGGNSIQFALHCKKVIAIDIDAKKIELAKHNAKIYGVVDKIQFIRGDYLLLGPTLQADVVFLSPPWGGPKYINQKTYDLQSITPNYLDVFEVTRKITKNIAFFVPRNSCVNQLIQLADEKVEIEQNLINSKRKAITAYYGSLIKQPT